MRTKKTVALEAQVIRGELTKIRCWITGFNAGTGKSVPGEMILPKAIQFLDDRIAEAGD